MHGFTQLLLTPVSLPLSALLSLSLSLSLSQMGTLVECQKVLTDPVSLFTCPRIVPVIWGAHDSLLRACAGTGVTGQSRYIINPH